MYEIVPVGEKIKDSDVPPLKYQTTAKLSDAAKSGEWLTVRMRYKDPQTEKPKEVEAALSADTLGKKVSNNFEFAAAAASFGMLLRDSEYKGVATYGSVLETAQGLLQAKKDDYREEFVKLVPRGADHRSGKSEEIDSKTRMKPCRVTAQPNCNEMTFWLAAGERRGVSSTWSATASSLDFGNRK